MTKQIRRPEQSHLLRRFWENATGFWKNRLGEQGLDVVGSSSAEMLAVMMADNKKWSEVIAATGAKVPQ